MGAGPPGLFLFCVPEGSALPQFFMLRPPPGGGEEWASISLIPPGPTELTIGDAALQPGIAHVAWADQVKDQPANLRVGSVSTESNAPPQIAELPRRRLLSSKVHLAVTPAGTALVVYYNLPVEPSEAVRPGNEADRDPAFTGVVFSEERALNEATIGYRVRRRGEREWGPPGVLTPVGSLGEHLGLAAAPGGFHLVWAEMDVMSGLGFALRTRHFDEARGKWGPIGSVGPNPYGNAQLGAACTTDAFHVVVRTTFTERLFHWRLPLKPAGH